jgi:hypothetical protein
MRVLYNRLRKGKIMKSKQKKELSEIIKVCHSLSDSRFDNDDYWANVQVFKKIKPKSR